MTAPRSSWGRALRIAFVVAACLSFLANAAMVGVGLRLAGNGVLGGGVGMMITEMPRAQRQIYADALRAERPELRRLIKALQDRRKAMVTIAAADPVDTAALDRAMAEVRAATTALQGAAHKALLRAAEQRTAEQRTAD